MRAAAARFADAAAVGCGTAAFRLHAADAIREDAGRSGHGAGEVARSAPRGLRPSGRRARTRVRRLRAVRGGEASELAGIIALAPVWRDARATQNALASPTGAAGLLVTVGSPHAVGRVIRDTKSIDTLIESAGGAFAADGDAAGTTFDAVPSEAVFYADAAVAFVPSFAVVAASAGDGASSANGAGTREIRWGDVVVVRRPKPPGFVRRVGGRGWSARRGDAVRLIIHMINTDDPTSGARTSALRAARWRVSRVSPSGRAPRGARVRADGTRRRLSFARQLPRTPRVSRPPSSASGDTGNRRLTSRSSPGLWRRESASSGVLRPRRARRTSPCATGTGTPRFCVSPSTRR